MRTARVALLPHQLKVHRSRTPITCFVGGRGSGKTYCAAFEAALALAKGNDVLCTAQSYRMLKFVLYKAICSTLDSLYIPYAANAGEMTIKANGGTAYFFSADTSATDSIRGLTNISLLIMDEAAIASEEFYLICMATMRGASVGTPRVIGLSTPRGDRNWFSRLAVSPGVTLVRACTRDNTKVSPEYIRILETQYKGRFARQELEGAILSGEFVDQLISTQAVYDAANRRCVPAGPKILGVDMARFGDDKCVGVLRQGRASRICFKLEKPNTFAVVNAVKMCVGVSDTINFDGSGNQAGGPVDILRAEKYNVHEMLFGGVSPDPRQANLRSYMYCRAREAIDLGAAVPDDEFLKEELISQRYTIDRAGRIALLPKEIVKQELGRSCDTSDAFALTFALPGDLFPVSSEDEISRDAKNKLDYLYDSYK